jgi:hypothetical protein
MEGTMATAKKVTKKLVPSKSGKATKAPQKGWRGSISFDGKDGTRSVLFARRVDVGNAVRFPNGLFASVVQANHSIRDIVLRTIPSGQTSMTGNNANSTPLFAVPVLE